MISRNIAQRILLLFQMLLVFTSGYAQENNGNKIDTTVYRILKIKPGVTDPLVKNCDTPSVIIYNPLVSQNKILLWLTGTGGNSLNIPKTFINTALECGYRIISLSFISTPGVSQICVGNRLETDSDCASAFRRKRVYGDGTFEGIPDEPQDAIIPRLQHLLKYLDKNDPQGGWNKYINSISAKPNWGKIAVVGQSQGGGMAEYIAQNEAVSRVISFSGGWDFSNSKTKKIAGWYYNKNVTPADRWYATYHVNENAAKEIAEICRALKIPRDHIFALQNPLSNRSENANKRSEHANPYHVEGIRNPVYLQIWKTLLGTGLD
ncbi:MAG: hypothetical protein P0Y49_15845 [Candidatus Pedobacter colombiensis]|uniref:Alpha/beta hydrolase n=1 Tax=Candidatus Pedobacter colombiensis TaxID=3121371 RepID=A0AAJ5W575_9SPHI|nr:hypothetical protein [Pedobacter sp.]WEK18264.1 MAG: hypothetical protein P0Y49_15845 [Pedobacter sp.]